MIAVELKKNELVNIEEIFEYNHLVSQMKIILKNVMGKLDPLRFYCEITENTFSNIKNGLCSFINPPNINPKTGTAYFICQKFPNQEKIKYEIYENKDNMGTAVGYQMDLISLMYQYNKNSTPTFEKFGQCVVKLNNAQLIEAYNTLKNKSVDDRIQDYKIASKHFGLVEML
ncbi:hypothetical protein ACFL1H_06895 [Nanoarchaeota archaeon]